MGGKSKYLGTEVQRADLYRRMLGAFPDLSCIILVDFNFSEFTVTANELFGNCPQYRFMALEETSLG